MKYCSHCGVEVIDEAVVCIKCGCSVANTTNQVVSIVNPNDASSKGFAVLGFFLPIVGFILFLVWNNTSPKKAKSCGIGALIGVFGIPLIIIIGMLITTASVVSNNIMNRGSKDTRAVADPSGWTSIRPVYNYFDMIGTITVKTKDYPTSSTVTVEVLIGYDEGDTMAGAELIRRRSELHDFLWRYFAGKTAAELAPEREEELKKEIREQLNTRFLDSARARIILFNKLDVLPDY